MGQMRDLRSQQNRKAVVDWAENNRYTFGAAIHEALQARFPKRFLKFSPPLEKALRRSSEHRIWDGIRRNSSLSGVRMENVEFCEVLVPGEEIISSVNGTGSSSIRLTLFQRHL